MVEVVVLVEAAVMHVTLMVTAVLAEHMPVMVEVMEVMESLVVPVESEFRQCLVE